MFTKFSAAKIRNNFENTKFFMDYFSTSQGDRYTVMGTL